MCMNDDDDFDDFVGDDDAAVEPSADTITVRNGRHRKSWRDIERLREATLE